MVGSSSPAEALHAARVKFLYLALPLAVTLATLIFFNGGGHLSVDEGVYHMMVQSFSTAGDLSVWNGYQEFPSPELVLPVLRVHDGLLFPSYPYLFPVLATPFYWLAGYKGLFILNALAFFGVVALTFVIAQKLFRDSDLARNACVILVLATFAAEYSQAAWPHALTMLFVTGAVYCSVAALQACDRRRSIALNLAAGLVVGFGVGVRLDVVFVLPALFLPFMFTDPWRPWQAAAGCVGTLPGLLVLALTNHAKFGTVSPFSYGVVGSGAALDPWSYLPLGAFGLVAIAALWAGTRPEARAMLRKHRAGAAIGAIALAVIFTLSPIGWQVIYKLTSGAYQLVVDLRIRDLELQEMALSRGPTGGMVYMGSLKKSLLQNCPYLVILAVPLAKLLRGGKDSLYLGLLFLTPVSFIAVFSYLSWHGGLALNLRYFLPIFPFTSILCAYAWRDLTKDLPSTWRRAALYTGLAMIAVAPPLVLRTDLELEAQEAIMLTWPLVLALVMLALVVASLVTRQTASPRLRGATGIALVVAFVWAGMVCLIYDMPRTYLLRSWRAEFVRSIDPFIEPDSILFVTTASPVYGLMENRRVRLAVPHYDNYRDFRSLVDFHLQAARPVYVWLDQEMERANEKHGLLQSLTTDLLYEEAQLGRLVQLRRAVE